MLKLLIYFAVLVLLFVDFSDSFYDDEEANFLHDEDFFSSIIEEHNDLDIDEEGDQNDREYIKRKFWNSDSLKEGILNNYDQLDIGERKYEGITLAYVTPWNNHGYDVVKWAAKKFTHISPVWFQVNLEETRNEMVQYECAIAGTHDIDRGWMEDILKNNSDIKFLPRFHFNGFTADSLKHFLLNEQVHENCARTIVEFIKRNQFDGAVIEIWLQVNSMVMKPGDEYLMEFIDTFSKRMHEENLIVVLPLTPPLDHRMEESGVLNQDQVARLSAAVDYINLMAYDFVQPDEYGKKKSMPVAPLKWARNNLNYLIEDGGVNPAKILMGLNWYGYRYEERPSAILGNDFIEYLSDSRSSFQFDSNAKEFRVIYNNGNAVAYFPTTLSLSWRLNMSRDMQLGGVAIWESGQGLDHFTSVF